MATVGVLPEVGSIVSGMATGGRDSGGVSIGDGVGITSTQTISTVVEDPLLDPLEEETLDPLLEPLPVLATPEPLEEPLLELTETLLPLLDPLLEEVTMMVPAGQTTSVTSTHFSALEEVEATPLSFSALDEAPVQP